MKLLTTHNQPEERKLDRDNQRPAEYAQLSVLMSVPIDNNYQSLKTGDQMQHEQHHYENTRKRFSEENPYEIIN